MSFACEFLDAAKEGDLVEAIGGITRAGGSLIFLRGTLVTGDRPLFTFSRHDQADEEAAITAAAYPGPQADVSARTTPSEIARMTAGSTNSST